MHELDLRPRRRPGFTVSVHLCTWDLVVLRVKGRDSATPVFVAKASDEIRAFLDDLDAGRRDADLVASLRRPPRRTLRRPPRPRPRIRAGIEHEYVVHSPQGPVDFRTLVDSLDLGVRADPTDPHAQRCPWGGVVTADGVEAEVATPPVELAPGSVADVVALAAAGRSVLENGLGDEFTLDGYSTHLNVSAPRRGDRGRALRFAAVFAPSVMLLLDRASSPGLLVRPRPGRLELGGEFAAGERLEVALTFTIGAVLAVTRMSRQDANRLAVEVTLERARERFGWFVDRRAFGADLYALGRATPLVTRGPGGRRTAGDHLELTWSMARSALVGKVGDAELAAVDGVVGGDLGLPMGQDGDAS